MLTLEIETNFVLANRSFIIIIHILHSHGHLPYRMNISLEQLLYRVHVHTFFKYDINKTIRVLLYSGKPTLNTQHVIPLLYRISPIMAPATHLMLYACGTKTSLLHPFLDLTSFHSEKYIFFIFFLVAPAGTHNTCRNRALEASSQM